MRTLTEFYEKPDLSDLKGTPLRILEKIASGVIRNNARVTDARRHFGNRNGEFKIAISQLEQRNCIRLVRELNIKTGKMGAITIQHHQKLIRLLNDFSKRREN